MSGRLVVARAAERWNHYRTAGPGRRVADM